MRNFDFFLFTISLIKHQMRTTNIYIIETGRKILMICSRHDAGLGVGGFLQGRAQDLHLLGVLDHVRASFRSIRDASHVPRMQVEHLKDIVHLERSSGKRGRMASCFHLTATTSRDCAVFFLHQTYTQSVLDSATGQNVPDAASAADSVTSGMYSSVHPVNSTVPL